MQIKGKYSWVKHLDFMIVDLVALFLSFILSYYLKFGKLDFAQKEDWVRYLFLVLILSVVINFFVNPYSGILRRAYYMEIIKALQLSVYNLMVTTLVFYALKIGAYYSREMSFYMYGFYFVTSLLLKYLWKKLLVTGRVVVKTTKQIPLFIVGSYSGIQKTIRNVNAGDFKLYEIEGIHLIDAKPEEVDDGESGSIPVYGEDYVQHILDNNIEEVLIAVSPNMVESGVLEKLNANGVGLNVVVELAIGFQPEDQYIQNVGVFKALSVGSFSFTPGQMLYLGVKRLIDILCSLIGLIVLLPIAIVVKLANLLSGDTARIFYRQIRVGQNGKKISIWKFRSMVPNADEMLSQLLKDEAIREEWEKNQKLEKDPRITKIGRILRKTSIDELPQLINVLKGEMSLVGPRPLVIGELEQHDGLKLYQKVKPGITGWWGCNGRSSIDYRERLELEYYYVKNCSLYLDILCIMRTAIAVLKKDGAK